MPLIKDQGLKESFEMELAYWQLTLPKDPKLEELKDVFKTIHLPTMDE